MLNFISRRRISRLMVLLAFSSLVSNARAEDEGEESSEESSSEDSGDSESEESSDSGDSSGSEGRIVHKTGESAAKNAAWVKLDLSFRKQAKTDDYRNFASGDELAPGTKRAPDRIGIFETEFGFRVAAWGYANRGAYVDLVGHLPFRHFTSSNPEVVQGSELGGFDFGLEGTPIAGLQLRAAVANRRSGRFSLIDSHYAVQLGARYLAYESAGSSVSVGAKLGPDYTMTLPQSDAAYVTYGNTIGLVADVFTDIRSAGYIFMRTGAIADLKRLDMFKIEGVPQGGAGLLAVSPYVEFPIVDILWIGLRYDIPVFRPKGQELAFGSVAHPGLFGGSLNLTLQAMNF